MILLIVNLLGKFCSFQPVLTIYRGEKGSEVKIYDSASDKDWKNLSDGESASSTYWTILTYDANTRTITFNGKLVEPNL